MRLPATLITRVLLLLPCLIIYCVLAEYSAVVNVDVGQNDRQIEFVTHVPANLDNKNSLATPATSSWNPAFLSTMCHFVPDFCAKMREIKEHFFTTGAVFEARGPKDLIAIIATMLASLLGAILVKLNVLIVLSLISVGIGKLLLLMLALKTKIFAGHSIQQQPVVYEKVYYPHHHHAVHQKEHSPESYPDEYVYS